VSFGTATIAALSENPFVQGLVVATAGGLTSLLAGGSFELGFITAGLAFATNAVLEISGKISYARKIRKVVSLGAEADSEKGLDFLAQAEAEGWGVTGSINKNGELEYSAGDRVSGKIQLPAGELQSIGIRAGSFSVNFGAMPGESISIEFGATFRGFGPALTVTIDVEAAVQASVFSTAVNHQKYGSRKHIDRCSASNWTASGC
jgi:hypothetical protein